MKQKQFNNDKYHRLFRWCIFNFPLQDDDGNAYNTSDEEFDRQLEEAALQEEQAKAEEAAAPKRKTKTKKGRGRGAKKKTKLTNKFPNNDPDAEGYEVC